MRWTRFTGLASSAGMLIVRFCTLGLGLTIVMLLTRLLGIEQYGYYAFAFALAQLFALPTTLGAPTLILRETAKAEARNSFPIGLISWALCLTVFASGLLFIISWVLSYHLNITIGAEKDLLLLTAVMAGLIGLQALGNAVINGLTKPLISSLSDGFVRPALFLGLVFSVGAATMPRATDALIYHIYAYSTAVVFTGALVVILARKLARKISTSDREWQSRQWLASTIPLSLSSGISVLNQRLDILMLGIIAGPVPVAIYAVASRLASLAAMGQTIVNSQVAPRLASALQSSGGTSAQRIVSVAVVASSIISFVALAGILLIGERLLVILFGDEVSGALPVLLVLACSQFVSSMLGPNALSLNMSGNEKLTLRASIIAVSVNAATNLPLVLLYGAIGAAIGTLIAQVTIQFIMMRSVRTKLQISTHIGGAFHEWNSIRKHTNVPR